MRAFQLCELSHHVSTIAMRSWSCDHTQISSCSCLFPMLCVLLYRQSREEKEKRMQVSLEKGAGGSPIVIHTLRWLAFWLFIHWKAVSVYNIPTYISNPLISEHMNHFEHFLSAHLIWTFLQWDFNLIM